MRQEKNRYLKIFKLEMTHLVEDVSRLIQYEKELHDNNEHTHFVYLENLVVLKDEIMGINGILGHIDKMASELDDITYVEDLSKSIEAFIKTRGYPMVVLDLVKSKIKKIEEIKKLY